MSVRQSALPILLVALALGLAFAATRCGELDMEPVLREAMHEGWISKDVLYRLGYEPKYGD